MKFSDLYQEHYSEIRRYLARFVADMDAEDLAQSVFVKANKGLKEFRGDSTPRVWLYRIANNALKDFKKSKSQRAREAEVRISPAELDRCGRSGRQEGSVEKGVLRREMNDCIGEFIHRLPEDYATVLILSDLEGYKNSEISDVLGISLENVKIRLHRARARLRAELQEGCDFSYNCENELECQRRD